MNRWVPLPFLALMLHGSPSELVITEPIIVTGPAVSVHEYRRNASVRYEAKRWNVPYRIASAVSHAENYNGDSTARNPRTSALGVMQIHPSNFGDYDHECYGPGDMTNLRRNSCYGLLLLRGYYDETGSWSAALRKYLGFKNNTQALLSYLNDIVDHMIEGEMR